MAFSVRPIVATDVGSADAARGLILITPTGAFNDAIRPETYVHPILMLRTQQQITLRGALVLVRHVVVATGQPSLTYQWPPVAAVECLGQVDCSTLSLACLGQLLRQAKSLSFLVLGGNVKNPAQLASAVAARKAVVVGSCGDAASPWLTFLDRVGAALTPVIGITTPV